ncbi:DNA-(apurinic or apyrimidinic site) endonuclease 2 [Eublepharis macularius]|uniref:DNA-(apurinic or apyrimidinic site) endonuclease n=1 Tax=Eublepharis macularius TaxID=481883 RepID=A0AA97KP66_EUBMA|nr:DNA-(apurinic or apyrimidinic site) endonuclease 2 [Eublepharis macularius]
MRLVSWNVNGLRAAAGPTGPRRLLEALGADVVCLQETKLARDLLEEPLAIVEGYSSYFSFSRTRSGYSGVATFCKTSATPDAAEEGLSGLFTKHSRAVSCYGDTGDFTPEELQALDSEGRAVITRHRICTSEQQETTLTIINVYCPRADPDKPERGDFKLRFCRLLQARAEALLRAGGHVVILGDINIAHKAIDHCDPGDVESFLENPGRRWLDSFLWEPGKDSQDEKYFVDTFRFLHPSQGDAYTCWCNLTGARQTNYGTRIDYILADRALALSELKDAQLMPEVLGSDHCPVQALLRASFLPARICPPLCTRFLPEFAGTQQKLSRFLVKVEQTSLLEKGQKQNGTEPSLGLASRKRQPGLPKKGQGDLLRFFRASSKSTAGATDLGRCRPRLSITQEVEKEPGKDPPLDAAEKTAEGLAVEKAACVPQGFILSLSKEPDVTMTGEEAKNCRNSSAPSRLNQSAALWKSLLPGPAPPPQCKVHGEPCVLRTVKKQGPNCGRRFYVCARPLGKPSDPRARCNFFLWATRGNP